MATGDNTFTGISVAREWGIITKDEIYVANLEKFSTIISFEKMKESDCQISNSSENQQIDECIKEEYSSDDELASNSIKIS